MFIILNALLFIICMYLMLKIGVLKYYSQQLFFRAWRFETFLMDIYNDVSPEIRSRIDAEFANIKPL